jgi:sugar lactone lactonase YvrE
MYNNKLKYLLPILILGIIIIACEKEVPSWTDPNPPGVTAPQITAIEPDTAYGGEVANIYGSNFNSDPNKNFIVIGKESFLAESSTDTSLSFHLPVIGGVNYLTLPVKVTAEGSENWSNEIEFTYNPVLEVIVTDDEEAGTALGIGVDDDDNIYYSLAHAEIIKLEPNGTRSVFASGDYYVGDIKIGPNNRLYAACCGYIAVFELDGTKVEDIALPTPPKDFDWDDNGNLYFYTMWGSVYQFDGVNTTEIEALGSPMELKVFDNHLYISDGHNYRILKYEITPGGVNRVDSIITDVKPFGLDFDVDGTIYYTAWGDNKIFYIKQDGTNGTMYSGSIPDNTRHINLQGKLLYTNACSGDIRKFYIGVEGSGY